MAEISNLEDLVTRIRETTLPSKEMRRSIREAAGVTIREAAEAMGVDPMTLWRWENGATPRRSRALAYRKLLETLKRVGR